MTTVETLRQDGICLVESLSTRAVNQAVAELFSKQRYDGHVAGDYTRPARKDSKVTCWSMHDVILAPHLFEFALRFNNIAREYLETDEIYLYSMNAFVTYPQPESVWYLQEFHQDHDDVKFLALFMYLSGIYSSADGSHKFIKNNGVTQEILGDAGTAFLANTHNEHKGCKPLTAARTIFWSRWGVTKNNRAYQQDKLTPLNREAIGDRYPSDEKTQEIIQLIVN